MEWIYAIVGVVIGWLACSAEQMRRRTRELDAGDDVTLADLKKSGIEIAPTPSPTSPAPSLLTPIVMVSQSMQAPTPPPQQLRVVAAQPGPTEPPHSYFCDRRFNGLKDNCHPSCDVREFREKVSRASLRKYRD